MAGSGAAEVRTTKDVPVPATVRQQEVMVTCDICGRTGDPHGRAPFGEGDGGDNVNECEIKREYGYSYGVDYEITTESYDVCPACWTNVLVPLFKNPPKTRVFD